MMRKFLAALGLTLALAAPAYAQTTISSLPMATPSATDVIPFVRGYTGPHTGTTSIVNVQTLLSQITAAQVETSLGYTPVAPTGDVSNTTSTATGGTTARTLAARAIDPGYSVLEKGAVCDGTTNDYTAIQAALNSGNTLVTAPPGKKCFTATGLVVPAGVAFIGGGMAPSDPPSGSEILCASSVTTCVEMNEANQTTQGGFIGNLVIASNATGTPSGNTALYVNSGNGVTVERVMAWNFADGFSWYDGINGHMREVYTGNISDAHVIMDAWPEIAVDQSRFGTNGTSMSCTAVLRFQKTANVGSAGGPNTFKSAQNQYNAPCSYMWQFINNTGTGGDLEQWYSEEDHGEGLTTAFVYTDSTWTDLFRAIFNGDVFTTSGSVPFFALNGATEIDSLIMTGNVLPSIALAPTSLVINYANITGNDTSSVSITGATAGSNLVLNSNNVNGTITIAGTFGGLSLVGDRGTLTNTATATITELDNGIAPTFGTGHLTGCGTNPGISANATGVRGTVTEGSSATGCTIALGTVFGAVAPQCIVTSPSGSTATGYSLTGSSGAWSLVITNSSATGDKFTWNCKP